MSSGNKDVFFLSLPPCVSPRCSVPACHSPAPFKAPSLSMVLTLGPGAALTAPFPPSLSLGRNSKQAVPRKVKVVLWLFVVSTAPTVEGARSITADSHSGDQTPNRRVTA